MSPLRRLLRSVRALARPPWRLAALLGRPLRRFHPKLQRVVRIPGGPHPFSDEAIWHLSGQRAEFAVPPVARTARGLCPALEVVTSYEDDLAELQRRLEALQVFTHRLAQLAPAPLIPSSPAAPAAQRRREGLRMLQPGEKVEVGSILIAHPMSCIFQPDLDRAVIVIDEVHPGHVRGLVLDKPGGILMETLKPEELERAKEAGLSGLLHNRLYLGGDLMDAEDLVNHVRWLHSSDLPGAQGCTAVAKAWRSSAPRGPCWASRGGTRISWTLNWSVVSGCIFGRIARWGYCPTMETLKHFGTTWQKQSACPPSAASLEVPRLIS